MTVLNNDRFPMRLSALRSVVRAVYEDAVMGQNFISADREQVLLMPPALVDWLPDEHFVWTVIGAVEQMDLSALYGAYRANGQGRAAYDPQMCPELNRSSQHGWPVTLRQGVTTGIVLGDAAVVVEVRPEGGPERR